MLFRICTTLSLSSIVLLASSLNIYSDRSFYTYKPSSKFIGFNTSLKAKDSTGSLELVRKNSCEVKDTLCSEFNDMQNLHVKLFELSNEQSILESLLKQYQPQIAIDAKSVIQTSKKIAHEMAVIENESKITAKELKHLTESFSKHTLSKEPIYYAHLPKSEVTLDIKNGLYFKSEYLLDIDNSSLQHSIILTNRSGVDIKADDVNLYATPAGYIRAPIKYYPRKIRTVNPATKRYSSRDEVMSIAAPVMAAAPVAKNSLHVSKSETRSYKIKNLTLNSDAKEKRVTVDTQKQDINLKLTWHPYISKHVYHTAIFSPKEVIESRNFKIRYKNRLIENAPIRKDAKDILVNIAVDYDVEVKRERLNEFSQDNGIFSSDRLKQDGFKLTLTNHSNRAKSIKITERIPLSTQDEITVSLDRLDLPYRYNKKSGKLSITADLKANESRTIKVSYTIRYPKDMQISY
jgi:hypothetical protein